MKRTNNLGFTLIELMITLAVAVVVLTLAAPAFRDIVIRNRVAAEINPLVATLNQGRSEAIKRGRSVTLCNSSNGTSCTGSWPAGWILFEDSDADGTLDPGETAIKVSNGFTSSSDTLTYTAASTYVRFRSNGFSQEAGSFKLCESGAVAKYARALYISTTGRIRLSSDTNSNGVHDDGLASPTELSCP